MRSASRANIASSFTMLKGSLIEESYLFSPTGTRHARARRISPVGRNVTQSRRAALRGFGMSLS